MAITSKTRVDAYIIKLDHVARKRIHTVWVQK